MIAIRLTGRQVPPCKWARNPLATPAFFIVDFTVIHLFFTLTAALPDISL